MIDAGAVVLVYGFVLFVVSIKFLKDPKDTEDLPHFIHKDLHISGSLVINCYHLVHKNPPITPHKLITHGTLNTLTTQHLP